jgi:hypothetical protein
MSTNQLRLVDAPEPRPDLAEEARRLRAGTTRKNTDSAYAAAWEIFAKFCKDHQRRDVPASPATVSEYLTYLHTVRKYAPRTIKQHKAAIRRHHHQRAHVDPCKNDAVHDVWRGIILNAAQDDPKLTYALWQRSIETVIDTIDAEISQQKKTNPLAGPEERLTPVRDRALVLLSASSGLLTLYEIHSLTIEEMIYGDRALDVRVTRSPDPIAKPRLCTIKFASDPRYCPVRALDQWFHLAELTDGPVFRAIDRHGRVGRDPLSARNIRAIVKRRCALANIDERMVSMRSLRQGAIQQRAYNGASVGELLNDAGLSNDSAAAIATLAAPARQIRERGRTAPDRLEIETFPI